MGTKNKALLDFIPFENCVVDVLHMCLRITDNLFNHLLLKIEELDGDISSDLLKRPLLKMLWDFFETSCKSTKPFYLSHKQNNGSKIKLRSLNHAERLKFMERMFNYQFIRYISRKISFEWCFFIIKLFAQGIL